MNWKALNDNKCPKCGGDLNADLFEDIVRCTSNDFSISQEKFEKIVGSVASRKALDQFSHLNTENDLG